MNNRSGSIVEITDTHFNGCKSKTRIGAMYIEIDYSGGTFTINESSFTNCICGSDGGAMYI
jgi:hypothetical protein